MEITGATISHLLHLARLEAAPQQEEALKADLQKMVGFIEKLNELDTTGVEPLRVMGDAGFSPRADEVSGSISRVEALRNAPLPDERFFKVPTVIKK